jgi:hypothetical protein
MEDLHVTSVTMVGQINSAFTAEDKDMDIEVEEAMVDDGVLGVEAAGEAVVEAMDEAAIVMEEVGEDMAEEEVIVENLHGQEKVADMAARLTDLV